MPSASSPGFPRPRVLVIDDQRAVRRLVAACLRGAGFDPAVAGDLPTALAHVEEAVETGRSFAVAICDLMIPGGSDGHAIARTLRRIDPGLPIVAISGYPELAICKGKGSPFCAFVQKPFSPDQLGAVVAGCARSGSPVARGEPPRPPDG